MDKKTKDSTTVLMELQVLTNVYSALKTSSASPSTLQATEDLINKKLAQVQ